MEEKDANIKIAPKHYQSMNYLRALAVILILWCHLVGMRTDTWIGKKAISFVFTEPLHIIQNFGALGVSIFFIISGFLMGMSIDSECSKRAASGGMRGGGTGKWYSCAAHSGFTFLLL